MILKLVKFLFVLLIGGLLLGAALVGGAYWYVEKDLPSTENLRDIQFQVPLRVFSSEGALIAQFGEKKRIPVAYEDTPQLVIDAFLAAEDDNFFYHPGIDIPGLVRAAISLAVTGQRRQGGSTITMQVARNFYLSRERTYLRKIKEIFLALKIERELSKQQILELYLNKIYLGHRAYGVGAAAQIYYGKPLAELNLAETAMLAGLPKAPSTNNPITNPENAQRRRNYVLRRMRDIGRIDDAAYQLASTAPVTAKRHRAKIELEAPYVAEMVRSHMVREYGEQAYTAGFRVYTTIQAPLQIAADAALRKALEDYDRRHGWRGAEFHFDQIPTDSTVQAALLHGYTAIASLQPALVTAIDEQSARVVLKDGRELSLPWQGLRWAKRYISADRYGYKPKKTADILAVGDLVRVQAVTDKEGQTYWRLAQIPKISGALVSLRAEDGALLALSGGYDYYSSKFNRATQAERQPGSGFKAFIYSAALEAGYTAASLINDAPVVFSDAGLEESWRPQNYSGKFFGLTRLRLALTKSRNLVSIRLLRNIGIPYALEYIERFGFDSSKLPHNLTLALGSGVVTPWQMARGYATLANGGFLIEPYFIQRIEQQQGEVLYDATPRTACRDCAESIPQSTEDCGTCDHNEVLATPAEESETFLLAPRAITAENRFLMYSMMQDVIQYGTGRKARVLGRKDIAGKTGTSNDQRDAWFNGYNQSIVTNVWVGFDDNSKLGKGEVGGKAALPAWIDYMRVALKGLPDTPPEMPDGMVTLKIDPDTGLRAPAGQKNAIFEYFRSEYVPTAETKSPAPADETPAQNTTRRESDLDDLF